MSNNAVPNTQHPIPNTQRPYSRWRRGGRWASGAFGLACIALLGWAIGQWIRPQAKEPDSGPLLIAMQKLGQLHSAKAEFKEILSQESAQKPGGLAQYVPGAEAIVRWATHNQALVKAEGSVEAGIDLSQISALHVVKEKDKDGKLRLRVHLPPVTVYPPNVRVHVENLKTGLFYRDDNIVPDAEAEATRRFQIAAEQANLRHTAECNAVETLQKLQRALGYENVEFTFASASAPR